MSHFTPAEIEYLKSQRLGRLATVNQAGEPQLIRVFPSRIISFGDLAHSILAITV